MVVETLALFLARLIAGYCICLGMVGPMVTSGSWPRISLFVITGLSATAFAAGVPWIACAVVAGLALVIERARTFEVPVLSSTLWMVPAGLYVLSTQEGFPPTFSGLVGGIVAGGTLGTMLLGHSYLTARGLSFKPLRVMANVLFGLLAARALQVGLLIALADGLGMGKWIYLMARIAFGLLLPLLFAWMVVQCVKIESNQSATGILYAMTALVGTGELIAAFLYLQPNGVAA